VARDLARDHRVIVADVVDCAALAAELGNGAVFVEGDVSDPGDCARWIEQAESMGGLNVLVHSAGITREAVPAGQIRLADWHDVLRVSSCFPREQGRSGRRRMDHVPQRPSPTMPRRRRE
jgi:NAD(P)-dependent dehydrogenase (short-subunit alcohol dehydrogenase family)